jgi:Excisionase from transposon Tn916
MENCIGTVPIHLKMTLTTKEAAEYSNIGINKIDSMLRSPNCPFVCLSAQRSWSNERNLSNSSVRNW